MYATRVSTDVHPYPSPSTTSCTRTRPTTQWPWGFTTCRVTRFASSNQPTWAYFPTTTPTQCSPLRLVAHPLTLKLRGVSWWCSGLAIDDQRLPWGLGKHPRVDHRRLSKGDGITLEVPGRPQPLRSFQSSPTAFEAEPLQLCFECWERAAFCEFSDGSVAPSKAGLRLRSLR